MKCPTFFIKIKILFNLLVIISLALPTVLLMLIVTMFLKALEAFRCESFIETLRRFKLLFVLLFYSTKIIFTKNRRDYTTVYCLLRKIKKLQENN